MKKHNVNPRDDRRTIFMIKFLKVVAVVSFLTLVMAAFTAVVMGALSVDIEHTGGVPKAWDGLKSNESPSTLYLPVTYWDQLSDTRASGYGASDQGRQFEWSRYGSYSYGLQQGMVKGTLGGDGLPVAANAEPNSSFSVVNRYVTGNDPTAAGDGFYRWWHEVEGKSKRIEGQVLTFTKTGSETYQYGGSNVFPLDNVAAAKVFSGQDYNAGSGHNFYFTMKMEAPFTVKADGTEEFQFEGDDDVWVFLNGKLVLDIGGVHGAIRASFKINKAGSGHEVTAVVDGKTTQLDGFGLAAGGQAVISFFYAERNTTAANCLITIRSLQTMAAAIDTDGGLDDKKVNYVTSVSNTNPYAEMEILGLASWIGDGETEGFLEFTDGRLEYSLTPNTASSWQAVNTTAPGNGANGFLLVDQTIVLAPMGGSGDTVYFRYAYETGGEEDTTVRQVASVLTRVNGAVSVSSDWVDVAYLAPEKPVETEPGDDEGDGEEGDGGDHGDDDGGGEDSGTDDDIGGNGDGDEGEDGSDGGSEETEGPAGGDDGGNEEDGEGEGGSDPGNEGGSEEDSEDETTDKDGDTGAGVLDRESGGGTTDTGGEEGSQRPSYVPDDVEIEPGAPEEVVSKVSYLADQASEAADGVPAVEIVLLFDLVIFATSYCLSHVMESDLARRMKGWRVKVNANAVRR
jgi:fibro-slime domain-containing protein